MELYDVFDAEGRPLHKRYQRGQMPQHGEYMPVIHVWLRCQDGTFLIQQRAKTTDPIPNQWATTTGLPDAGETFLAAARRETAEELGLWLPLSSFKKVRTVMTHGGRYQTVTQVYLVELTETKLDLKINPIEVKRTAFKTLGEIRQKIVHDAFWNYPVLLQDAMYFSALEEAMR